MRWIKRCWPRQQWHPIWSLIRGLNARAFGQYALKYQYWNASGGNASVIETVGNIDNSRLVNSASPDASLAGFTPSAGFSR